MDQSKINTSSLNGLNNLKLRKKAKALVDEVRKSDDPVQAAERLIEEMTRVYGVNNRWAHATADMVLRELEVAFRSKEFKMSGKDSQHLLNKVTGTKDRIKESANENSFAGRAASNAKNIASSFMPTPSTLFRGMMISNPLLGAGVDAAKAIMGGPKDEVNFGDVDLENEEKGAGFTGQLSGIDGDEITSLVREQNLHLKELIRITSEAWDVNSKSMESMVEEAEEANNLTRAGSEDSFDDMELKREKVDEGGNVTINGLRNEKEEEGLGDDLLSGFAGGAGFLGGIKGFMGIFGMLGKAFKMLFKGGPIIMLVIGAVKAVMDLFDDSKNLANFGKTDLSITELISGFIANLFGGLFGIVDFFLGTDTQGLVKGKMFEWINNIFSWIGEATAPVVDFLKTSFDSYIGIWMDLFGLVKDIFTGIWEKVSGIIDWFKNMSLKKAWDIFRGKGTEVIETAKEKGSDIKQGFMDGLSRKPEFSSAGGRSRANRMRDTSTGTSPVIAPVSTNSQVNNTTNTTISSPQRSPYNYEDIGISAIPG